MSFEPRLIGVKNAKHTYLFVVLLCDSCFILPQLLSETKGRLGNYYLTFPKDKDCTTISTEARNSQ